MKISNSKKQLAKIIHENGGWRNGYGFSAQDGDDCAVWFYEDAPVRSSGAWWITSGLGHCGIEDVAKLPNWNQTILSRDEYFHLYPAPDAEAEQKAEIRWVRGKDIYATPTAHDCMEMLKEKLGSTECGCDECSAFYSKPAAHAESTIEQLATDYRNRKDYADRKQQEADAAKSDAEAKLAALVAAGKALGLVLSVAKPEPWLAIAVQVGDDVECIRSNVNPNKYSGMTGTVLEVDVGDASTPYLVDFGGEKRIWCHEVKFIRRPAKGGTNA